MTNASTSFVPDDLVPPVALDRPKFRLRPLGPEQIESDYAAWKSSVEHIHLLRSCWFETVPWRGGVDRGGSWTTLAWFGAAPA
jgi:hypothetical protein